MNFQEESAIRITPFFNEKGAHMLEIKAGAAIRLEACFLSRGQVTKRKAPKVQFDDRDESLAWLTTAAARDYLAEGMVCHEGLRRALYGALRGCGWKIAIVDENIRAEVNAGAVFINNCHVSTDSNRPGMHYACRLDGEVIVNLYCGDDRIPGVPIAFSAESSAITIDWMISGLPGGVRVGSNQVQANNEILQRWGGGEWEYLDEDLLPFVEFFPWPIFGEHLAGANKLKIDAMHFELAVQDALREHADSAHEKGSQFVDRAGAGADTEVVAWHPDLDGGISYRHDDDAWNKIHAQDLP